MASYEELLAQAKSMGGRMSRSTLMRWRSTTESLLGQMSSDLSGVELRDGELVQQLLAAKFNESGTFGADTITVTQGKPPVGGTVEVLGNAVLGKYPEAAFNVHVTACMDTLTISFFPVPIEGNTRR